MGDGLARFADVSFVASWPVCRNEIFHVFVPSQVTTHGKETNNVKKNSNGIKMLFLCFHKRLIN